jgi:hypothetical protein
LFGEVANPHLPKATLMLEEVAQGLHPFFHPFMEKKKLLGKKSNINVQVEGDYNHYIMILYLEKVVQER